MVKKIVEPSKEAQNDIGAMIFSGAHVSYTLVNTHAVGKDAWVHFNFKNVLVSILHPSSFKIWSTAATGL